VSGEADVPVQSVEDGALHVKNVRLALREVRGFHEVCDFGGIDFLLFGCNVDGGDRNQLQTGFVDS